MREGQLTLLLLVGKCSADLRVAAPLAAARLPFSTGIAAGGCLAEGVSVAATPTGRVMEVRRTLDFCTWKHR